MSEGFLTCPRCGVETHEVLGEGDCVLGFDLLVRALGEALPFEGQCFEGSDMLCHGCGEPVARGGMVHFKQGWAKATSVVSVGPELRPMGD